MPISGSGPILVMSRTAWCIRYIPMGETCTVNREYHLQRHLSSASTDNKGTRQIHVILYAKGPVLSVSVPADRGTVARRFG
jgi:hypothetical protein